LTFLLIINPVISFSLNDGQGNKRNEEKKRSVLTRGCVNRWVKSKHKIQHQKNRS
jgi:hypothetical protein